MSIFQHRYSAFANKLAITCYSMSSVHKYYTNIAQILQDCTNKEHGTTEPHGTHWAHRSNWATNERCGKHTVLQVMAFVFICPSIILKVILIETEIQGVSPWLITSEKLILIRYVVSMRQTMHLRVWKYIFSKCINENL